MNAITNITTDTIAMKINAKPNMYRTLKNNSFMILVFNGYSILPQSLQRSTVSKTGSGLQSVPGVQFSSFGIT